MQPPETVEVETDKVGCDGNGPLGHPMIYLTLDATGRVDCPYCGRRFVLRKGKESGAH